MERFGEVVGYVVGVVLAVGTWMLVWKHAPRFVIVNFGLGLVIIGAVTIGERVSKRRKEKERRRP